MDSPLIIEQYRAWGANPVPISFGETYNALQQKVVDGQENPLISIDRMKFYEVQDYLILSNHAYLGYGCDPEQEILGRTAQGHRRDLPEDDRRGEKLAEGGEQ